MGMFSMTSGRGGDFYYLERNDRDKSYKGRQLFS